MAFPSEEPVMNNTPFWVKGFGVVSLALLSYVLFVIFSGLGGQHGPARHTAARSPDVQLSSGLIVLSCFLIVASATLNWNWMFAGRFHSRRESGQTGLKRALWSAIPSSLPSMVMPAAARNFALAVHIVSSVGLVGAVVSFLALAIIGLTSPDALLARAAYVAMELSARFVIVPLAIAALIFGIAQGLGTKWGVFRHWWVLVKLMITVLIVLVLLLQMETISTLADAASRAAPMDEYLRGERQSLVVHAGLGLLVLLIPVALSLYKPRGLTPYGTRMQRELRGG